MSTSTERAKKWRLAHPEEAKQKARESYARHQPEIRERQVAARLVSRYGITIEQYNEMLDQQGGVCAVCKNPCTTGQRLSVDHNHKTGRVRALLCRGCNFKVGQLEKDWERTQACLNYLNGYWDVSHWDDGSVYS